MFQASLASSCRLHLMAPVFRSMATTASVVGAEGCVYASPVATYSTPAAASIVGADHTAAPDGPSTRVPALLRPTSRGSSAMRWVFQTISPVARSSATTLPRNEQHS